ncbi:MAG: carboxypeptidase regulatory-like domain-containing protein [Candidatus Marinimicrobia bacterium]|nr:carboxypeptidase regulatory-like domain-containing protein [Candidatus Neomarinimicrobiota bacterium]
MKQLSMFIVVLLLCTIVFLGCSQDDDNPLSAEETELPTYQPKGTITGVIKDVCTSEAIKGAVLSLSYNGTVTTVKSNSAGQFSFGNVPAGQFKVMSGAIMATGTYTITASLVDYNKSLSDTTKRYRNYYYSTVTITFTSLVPGDSLGVSGLVGSVVFNISQLNTTIVGQVVDEKMQPVASAYVILGDLSITPGVILKQTQTDVDGNYRFTDIDNGISVAIMARSADGKYEGGLPSSLSLPCNLMYDSLRSRVTAERIQLHWANDVAPYVIDITPQNNSDVSHSGLEIIYTFSVPIKQTPYTRTDLGRGHGTILDDIVISYLGLKKSTGTINSDVSWNTTMTQLTIHPSNVVGSAKYSIDVRHALPKLEDEAGLNVVNNTNIIGDFEVLNFTTAGQSTIPAAPVLSRRIVAGIYEQLDYDGGIVSLEWNSDPDARSYNLYRQIGNGPFELINPDVFSLIVTNMTGMLVTPAINDPLSALTVKYQVRAVSKDLVEGPSSNTITASDGISPSLINALVTNIAMQRYQIRLRFSEPLSISAIENVDNYFVQDPDTVVFVKEQAAYIGYNAGNDCYEVLLTVSISNGENLPAGFSLRIGSGVVDLAGNSIDNTADTYVYSAPPTPILLSPDNGATNVSSASALKWKVANGAISYRLQISTNAAFTAIVFDNNQITSTGFNLSGVTGLLSGTKYYWRVQAANSVGTSSYSPARSFTLK